MTRTAAFWINAIGVWGIDLLSLALALFVDLAWGLVAVYLTVANGIVHLLASLRLRAYNPGLWTALGLFLPLGGWALHRVSVETGAPWRTHALVGSLMLLGHAGIALHVRLRLARLRP